MERLALLAEIIDDIISRVWSLAFRNGDGGQNPDHDSLAFLEQHPENCIRSYSLLRHTHPHKEVF